MALLVGTYYNNNTNSYSSFQSLLAGVGSKSLLLNPLGGNVGIGVGRTTTMSSLLYHQQQPTHDPLPHGEELGTGEGERKEEKEERRKGKKGVSEG